MQGTILTNGTRKKMEKRCADPDSEDKLLRLCMSTAHAIMYDCPTSRPLMPVAVCCSVVQCGAAWCSVLQCGAVCCSVLHMTAPLPDR